MSLGRRFHGAALAALLAAAVPVSAPWCDAWCIDAHHAAAATTASDVSATGEAGEPDHSHCLEMMLGPSEMAAEQSETATAVRRAAGLECRTLPTATSVDDRTAERVRSLAMQILDGAVPVAPTASSRRFVRDTGPSPPHPPPTHPLALRL